MQHPLGAACAGHCENDGKAHNPDGNFKPFAQMVQSQGGQSYAARGEKINL